MLTGKARAVITTEKEFLEFMEEVDAELREAGVEIPARHLLAMSVITKRLKITLRLTPPDAVPAPGSYQGDDLSIRIYRSVSTIDTAIGSKNAGVPERVL